MNEVSMFTILVFGKFVALFLMVVHHLEFAYVVGGAVSFDFSVIVIGALSVSTQYVRRAGLFCAALLFGLVSLFIFASR